jgi:sec-independent protein translocase protein TatA
MFSLPLVLGWVPGPAEWIIIAAFGLLLFGKRLPEVGRSLGKGIVEFKKGLKGVDDEIDQASSRSQIPQQQQPKADPSPADHQTPA